jgi:hypothetical protein
MEQIVQTHTSAQPKEDQIIKYGGDIYMIVYEKDLVDIYIENIEETYNNLELQSLPLEKLCKVHKFYINSTTWKHVDLVGDWESTLIHENITGKHPRKGKYKVKNRRKNSSARSEST